MATKTGKQLRKQWKNEDMVAAIEAVDEKKLSICAAANQFKVSGLQISWSVAVQKP